MRRPAKRGDGYDTLRVRNATKDRVEAEQLRLRNQGRKVPVSDLIEAALDALQKRPVPKIETARLGEKQIEQLRIIAQFMASGERADMIQVVATVANELKNEED